LDTARGLALAAVLRALVTAWDDLLSLIGTL